MLLWKTKRLIEEKIGIGSRNFMLVSKPSEVY
jgi:hypothetical protein